MTSLQLFLTTTAARWLKRVPATASWVAVAIGVVVMWGVLDPFDIRQRLDWIVTDQFLQYRSPPPMHPDVLQVAMDDRAAERLGITDRRHRLARALVQLGRLGARTVLVDVLFLNEGSQSSFYQEEAVYDGIPLVAFEQNPELRMLYQEDRLLANALTQLLSVIPFQLVSATSGKGEQLGATIAAMARRLEEQPQLTADELASALNVPTAAALRLYEPALESAAKTLAGDPQRAARLRDGPRTPLTDRLKRALDRQEVLTLIRQSGSFVEPTGTKVPRAENPSFPPALFARTSALGFADVVPDADGALRRLPLVARDDGRVVVHQALAVTALHLGTTIDRLALDSRFLRISPDCAVLLDGEGGLIIDWPMNGREKWDAVIPQISLSDLLELAQYEADVHTARHDLRHNVALLDRELATGLECESWLLDILDKYAAGKAEFAAKSAAWFDGELVPQLLDHPKTRAVFEQLDAVSKPLSLWERGRGEGILSTESPSPQPSPPPGEGAINNLRDAIVDPNDRNPETGPTIAAQAVSAIRQQRDGIERLEAEYRQAFESLRVRVEGKLCLVGDTTTASTDLKLTPVGPEVPGIAVNVAAVNTMLSGRPLSVAGIGTLVLMTVVLAAALAAIFQRVSALPSVLLAVTALAAIVYGHLSLLERTNVLAGPVLPMTGVVACYFTVTTLRWWEEFREKRRIRDAFQHYLHPTVVDQISRNPELLTLGGRQANLTVLFSDIRGFSSISEQLSAPELVRLLNEYLTAMTQIVFAEGGTLDKYIGDAIMAFYGAPLPSDDHAFQACSTALAMTARLGELQQGWRERGLPVLKIGIGMNTAEVVVGNMGSDIRFDYTVMGDGVNLASRLEGATKMYGADVLISESTWEQVRDRIATRELDLIQVKGKEEPTRIFEVVGFRPLSTAEARTLEVFDEGLSAYRERRFGAALNLFRQALLLAPDDIAARLYIDRCEAFRQTPPPPGWNGVYVMTTK